MSLPNSPRNKHAVGVKKKRKQKKGKQNEVICLVGQGICDQLSLPPRDQWPR